MRRSWLLWLVALAWAGVALAALSPEAFTQEYATTLRAKLPGSTVEIVEPLQLRVTDAKGNPSTAYLDNAYRQYQQDPDARQEIIEHHAKSIAEMSVDTPLLPENIVPIIKDLGWIAETNRSIGESGGRKMGERVHEPLNEALVIVYAEDTPNNIRYFSPAALAEAGVKRDQLRALAVRNLRRLLPQVEFHQGDLFTMLTVGGTYEASLLLLEDLWTGGKLKVDGEIVVAVPSRDVLLVTGTKNEEGVRQMRDAASEIFDEGSYTLTKELFVYRGGKFVRYTR
jgi:uncharacterized protein YtpQ (UPF0354 family)